MNLPSRENIIQRIFEIENLDLQEASIEEISEMLNLLFTGYKINTPCFEPGVELFRGIKYSEKPKNISSLSYPPKNFAKINRASRESESIFYAGTSREVPFFELNLRPGDFIVLSHWITTTKIMLNNVGYTDENFLNLNSSRENEKWNPKASETEENEIIQNFLAKTFSQPVSQKNIHLYKLTIAIAEKHFKSEIFDGLVYPTVAMRGNAENFAIKPNYIDDGNLLFLGVEFIEVTKQYDFKYDINILDSANSISEQGMIEWGR
ncbi:hypothetical protein HYN48_13790 [Flavobacterium magnum]|uniref:RES domain-containing protein n=1 Tax=Flavobacterium magnum TaxID=2162713 RepID=A0A2S0RIW7_9FLAO|nr:hypothetical protein [Flavobacterium magnum]AWA31071.1 hypothetical protein HYN48_13790 [Flavobacterium magnum]